MKKEKFNLKKGDLVWVSLPHNARIKRVNKQLGYTLKTLPEEKADWSYFNDEDVQRITEPKKSTNKNKIK